MHKQNEYKIVRHVGLLSCVVYDLQLWSTTQDKWISMSVSNFEADIKHYCQQINKMNIYNDRSKWENKVYNQ